MDKALADLSAGVDRLIDQRAIFGSRLAQVDTESERLKTLETTMTIAQSKIESLDVAGAITQLQSAMTLLQASQQSFAQIKRSEEHTSELQSLMRNSYAVFLLKK